MDFAGKCVLVTGGARGIGRAICIAFAEAGARVAVNFRVNRAAADEVLARLPGGPHLLVQADVAQPDGARLLVKEVVDRFGRLDVLVNNVGGAGPPHRITELSYEEWLQAWHRTLAANLMSATQVTYWAVQQMLKQGGGRIVNVSSRGAFRGEPERPAYGAAKAGLNAMSQSLAVALARHNIYIAVVAPGFVATEATAGRLEGPEGEEIRRQIPFGRVAFPEEVARAVLFLAAPGNEYLTGAIVDVNGASYLRS
ncbi:MAG: SDR family oxidoreductase [candidate division KSB1 bacterium]|nr:SDR family oxidoreductase [candidate division KSB1 bacterium]MDZ7294072.1 SDR family oxidoreductase [candidate division KSB1 bacterium]MDZ7339235.1 SDR family oxidoreductase [candidate division KSB1 bacterium]MDZ7386229.1 SDR family oxidoreductase [candidate division KSB1 bacterium]MDZ7391395.1 SDR family oxidoreductase [candidate division KSB1 bacterium]